MESRAKLLHRYGLTCDQIDIAPKIAPILSQCGITPERVIEILSGDDEPDSAKIVQLWGQLEPRERTMMGMEGIALACGMAPRRLWGLYCGASLMQSRESIGAMIANSLPSIMAVTIKDAKKQKGVASREHIYKAARVLPTPKGTIINLPGSGGQKELEEPEDDTSSDMEGADDFLLRAAKAMNPKALPAPVVDAEVDEDDESDE